MPKKTIGKLLDEEMKRKNNGLILSGIFILSLILSIIVKDAGGRGISVAIFMTTSYILLPSFFHRTRGAFSVGSVMLAAANLLIAFSFLFSDSISGNLISTLALAFLFPLHISYMAHPESGIFSVNNIIEMFYALFGKIFICLGAPFKILFGKKSKWKGLLAFAGVVAAIPVFSILLLLFSGADGEFAAAMEKIFFNIDIPDIFGYAILSLIITILFTSFIYASCIDRDKPVLSGIRKGGIASTAIIGFLSPIILLECVYVCFQFSFMFLRTAPPSGYTYATYVHNGFGYSAAASAFTALIIIIVYSFCKRKNEFSIPAAVKVLLSIMNVCNLIILASSILRILMYISVYGLTVSRIIVLWFDSLLILIMIFFMIKIWASRFNILGAAGVITTAFIIILAFINPDYLCAKYNIDKYFEDYAVIGSKAEIDIDYLSYMSDSVIIQLHRLTDAEDNEVAERAENVIRRRSPFISFTSDWRSFCLTDIKVKKIIAEYPPINDYESDSYESYDYDADKENADYVSKQTDLDLPYPEYINYYDDHSGNGDGTAFAELEFYDHDAGDVERLISKSSTWHELPMSENLNLILYGGESDGIEYTYNFAEEWDIPVIENGYWYFWDRYPGEYSYSDEKLFNRYSFNFTAAVYDADTGIMYYLELDT